MAGHCCRPECSRCKQQPAGDTDEAESVVLPADRLIDEEEHEAYEARRPGYDQEPEEPEAEEDEEEPVADGWTPVPVPLPTYVAKAPAGRTVEWALACRLEEGGVEFGAHLRDRRCELRPPR